MKGIRQKTKIRMEVMKSKVTVVRRMIKRPETGIGRGSKLKLLDFLEL